jgi:SAM-dependent methyltransferase
MRRQREAGVSDTRHDGYVLGTRARHEDTRNHKADKIIALLEARLPLEGVTVLEVGTGAGYIAHALSRRAGRVESVDIVDDRQVWDGYTQTLVEDEFLPFADSTFDVVVSNHVLEHVRDHDRHLSEMRRVMRDDGFIYLATPNKWWLLEPHYGLPLLSWLPRKWGATYLRLTKRRTWDISSVSLRRLTTLAEAHGLVVEDRAWAVLSDPKKYSTVLPSATVCAVRLAPRPVVRLLLHVVPTHLKLLVPRTP